MTEKRSWKEKHGATQWSRNPEQVDADRTGHRGKALVDSLRSVDRSNPRPPAGALAAVCADPRLIARLVGALDDDDPTVARLAADVIEKTTRRHGDWLAPHRETLLDRIARRSDRHDVLRRLVPLVARLEPTATGLRRVTAALFDLADETGRHLQVCAIQALHDLAAGRPRLRIRVREVLERKMQTGTPAVRARARRLLAEVGRSRRRR